TDAAPVAGDAGRGRRLYETGCTTCHGLDGRGTDLGPPLVGVGAAAADFYLSTGRMPLDQPRTQADRKPPAYTAEQIRDLVAYVSESGGPPIPDVHPDRGDLAVGMQLYTANCAACHNSAASGGALGQAQFAPGLRRSTPLQIAEAIRIGPGSMPVFGPDALTDDQVDSIVRYLVELRRLDDRGGAPLGRLGPVPEGMVAWLAGLFPMLAAALWIGTREPAESAAQDAPR
ncbi:MAG: cytochrome bc1 complex diheme cytochrome c subunit, partial [Acidimicrobiia bacterium]